MLTHKHTRFARVSWSGGYEVFAYRAPVRKDWSGLQDLNLRPPGPKPGALANCAKPRHVVILIGKSMPKVN